MKAVLINEYQSHFQTKLNDILAGLEQNEIIDIKFSSTYETVDEKIVLHAIILYK